MGLSGKGGGEKLEDLYQHGYLFDAYIQRVTDSNANFIPPGVELWKFLGRFIIKGKSPNSLKRALKIKNLSPSRYRVELRPIPKRIDTQVNRRIGDSGKFVTHDTGVKYDGKSVIIEYESGGTYTDEKVDDLIQYDVRKRSTSSESGAPILLNTVNEVIVPSDVSKAAEYPGIALVGLEIMASERMQSPPEISLLINQGRIVRLHLAAGTVGQSSTTSTMSDPAGQFDTLGLDILGGSFLRNLTKHTTATITNFTPTTLTSSQPLLWEPGDRYLVYQVGASNYFPDIFVDTLINPKGGLGVFIDGDAFVDYPSIVNSRRFCIENKFFWDGVISSDVEWVSWITTEASGSLLFPSRIDGRFGLHPEKFNPPVAIFNESNIIKGTFEEDYLAWYNTATNRVVVTYTEGLDGRFQTRAVTVMTSEVFNNQEPAVEESLSFPAVTNRCQALRIGQVFLKTKRLQNKAVTFKTATQALYLAPGDLIIVQHSLTEFDYDVSGYAFSVTPLDPADNSQVVRLSRPPSEAITNLYRAATFFRNEPDRTKAVQKDIEFTLVPIDGIFHIKLTGLTQSLAVGDAIVIGKTVTTSSLYRTQSIEFSENGEASITAVAWTEEILSTDNLLSLQDGQTVICP